MGLFKFLGKLAEAAAEEERQRKEDEQRREREQKEQYEQELRDLEEMRKIAISKGDIAAKTEIDLNIRLTKARMSGDAQDQLRIQQEISLLHGNGPKPSAGPTVRYYDN